MSQSPAHSKAFIHCRVHSEYSMVDSVIRVKQLIAAAKDNNMPAVALTDHMNLFAVIRFYKAARAAGIKPLIGCDLVVREPGQQHSTLLTVLCQNNTGYHNLTQLISDAYTEIDDTDTPHITREALIKHQAGLILLSGGIEGDIGQALIQKNEALATDLLKDWVAIFGDRFYLTVSRIDHPDEADYIKRVCTLAHTHHVPVIATNNVRFIAPDDFEAHEARVCINRSEHLGDPKRQRDTTNAQYFRDTDSMRRLFADIPSAIENTAYLAQRCTVTLTLDQPSLPNFKTPDNTPVETYLRTLSRDKLNAYLIAQDTLTHDAKTYQQRLETELDVILSMGFASYFLIVADFIHWSKTNGIAVGPGRGSGAGSLVAFVLAITDIDPLPYDLLFERFLNPERVSMPDFDIDFCMMGRDRVIEYVAQRYGRHCVSQIITFGTMAAKAVIRDVGRVMGFPYGFVDQIAKLIPFELGITLDKALEQEETLKQRYDTEEDVRGLIDLAKKLEGLTRNAGKHAGGVVIAPTRLTDFTPLYCEPGSQQRITQFDKDDVEAAGLVKFDFLGLRTLTIIDWALKIINAERSEKARITLKHMSLTDPKPYTLLKACDTTAVFQLESRGMKDLIRRLQPDCFEDMVALVALFRPGPLQSGMVDDFIARKHGEAVIEYPHPDLEDVLKPTYGVILYQEQVMQIAQILAGYSLGGADLLRRAMGKKKPEEMAKQRALFSDGAVANGVEKETAESIFDLMEKFAGYGFNKSHSAAYALIAYQTAWLKTYYPAEFMAAVLSADMDNTDKVNIFLEDAKASNLTVLPPDINESNYSFTVPQPNTLRYGLGALKGIGQGLVEAIVQTRESGRFNDMFDLCERLAKNNIKLNKRALETLIKAGCFDSIVPHRAALLLQTEQVLKTADQHHKHARSGQADLFGSAPLSESHPLPEVAHWSLKQTLEAEKESLGLYLSGHPIAPFMQELDRIAPNKLHEITGLESQVVMTAGIVTNMRVVMTKRGKPMAFITLEDTLGSLDIVCFSDIYLTARPYLVQDTVLIVSGEASIDEFTQKPKIVAKDIWDLFHARCEFGQHLSLSLSEAHVTERNVLPSLKLIFNEFAQKEFSLPVNMRYTNQHATTQLNASEPILITPKDVCLTRLSQILGDENVTIDYN